MKEITRAAEAEYWNLCAEKVAGESGFDSLLAEQYRNIHSELISRWIGNNQITRILKTDLFAEATDPSRSFLWNVMLTNATITGIDISTKVTYLAKSATAHHAPEAKANYMTCDVRQLPFVDESFDLIISDSTLDHFHHKKEILEALSELGRVLKPGGCLIITMDNKGNITEPFFRIWIALRLYHFFIGETCSIRELKKGLVTVGLKVVDCTAIIHNPRFFVRAFLLLVRRLKSTRLIIFARKILGLLDGLENKPTRYLTGQFIAAKAIKPVR